MPKRSCQVNAGVISAVGAYMLWGFLPIYWKFIDEVPALEILAHRIFWSAVFVLGLLTVTGKISSELKELPLNAMKRQKIVFEMLGYEGSDTYDKIMEDLEKFPV